MADHDPLDPGPLNTTAELPPVEPEEDSPGKKVAWIFAGIGLVLLGHLVFLGIVAALSAAGVDRAPAAIIGIGLIQLVYAAPMFIIALKTGKKMLAVGIGTAAGLTLALNGACFGVLMGGVFH